MAIVTKTVRTVKVTKTVRTERTVKVKRRAKAKGKPNGVILYRGRSLLDGSPIVVVAVGLKTKSKNKKTGGMIATYVLADGEENPLTAMKTGGDAAVCGDCPHRGTACYVNVAQAPLAVWRAVKQGTYPRYSPAKHRRLFEGRFVRLGSYGDPAAVPFEVWRDVTDAAEGHTGYTHQWRTCDQRLASLCMASVDTPHQRAEAVATGWRTFRVRLETQPVEAGEFICPASEEAGKKKTCEQCRACSGAKSGTNHSPVIVVHGPAVANNWKRRMFERTVERLQAEEHRRFGLPTLN
jgi:hypothetical protein